MLDQLVEEKWLTAKGVFGIFRANSNEHDEIELYDSDKTKQPFEKFVSLRQQNKKRKEVPNYALSDFVAPKNLGKEDYVGCFCVTAGLGIEPHIEAFEKENDDYSAILLKSLADRLAEALAEYLHERIRKELWGYVRDEHLQNEELIKEKYRGIRPAPGYPSCPDHTEKKTIWKLLDVENRIGVSLTESLAMWPSSSVSGYYFSHPESKYFGLGKITMQQVVDFAKRKQMTEEQAIKWLQPVLAESES